MVSNPRARPSGPDQPRLGPADRAGPAPTRPRDLRRRRGRRRRHRRGCALDAATRGLSVALLEARDFAAGTSSCSSKLIHGGLRYLEQLSFTSCGRLFASAACC